MNMGDRFWHLIGMVFIILAGYALAELSDAVEARKNYIETQQQLLTRQKALLNDRKWAENLRAIEPVREAWMNYLPAEDSPAIAKANLLREIREQGKQAGVPGLIVHANDDDMGAGAAPNASDRNTPRKKDNKAALPAGVQSIALQVTAHFNPEAFAKFMRALKKERQALVVERVVVRGAQMELKLRSYWRQKTEADATTMEQVLPDSGPLPEEQ